MDRGFDPASGNLAARLAPDTSILTAPHDFYDIAFMLLAAAALIEAEFDVRRDLEQLETELARLKAPLGWHENAARSLPRRQNPHMHMFEASTALFAATGAERFRHMAAECLGLFREVFLAGDRRVLEYFDADWVPLEGGDQAVEPGHMAEWVYLLDRYETVTGHSCGMALEPLFDAVLSRCDTSGLLPDRSEPVLADSRRLWPQTELLKAAVALRRRGAELPAGAAPEAVLARMWQQYFETGVAGGWYDKRSAAGVLLSDNMPASTFYHILVAFRFYVSDGAAA
jgi:mannose-6-phosphate isomerase